MAKDPLAGNVSSPEGDYYKSSEEVRAEDAAKTAPMEETSSSKPEHLTRSEVINVFGPVLGPTLIEAGYSTISSLLNATQTELMKIQGIGKATARKIKDKLEGQLDEAVAPTPQPTIEEPEPPPWTPPFPDEPPPEKSTRLQRIEDSQKSEDPE